MLDELDSEYGDLVYFSNARWLSRAATLKIFWDLKSEIINFMKEKGQETSFWSELETSKQKHIQSFNQKLELFQSQLKKDDIVHLGTLKNMIGTSQVNHLLEYIDALKKLSEEFGVRFKDFRDNEKGFLLFANLKTKVI